jgi:hypothetical protein
MRNMRRTKLRRLLAMGADLHQIESRKRAVHRAACRQHDEGLNCALPPSPSSLAASICVEHPGLTLGGP